MIEIAIFVFLNIFLRVFLSALKIKRINFVFPNKIKNSKEPIYYIYENNWNSNYCITKYEKHIGPFYEDRNPHSSTNTISEVNMSLLVLIYGIFVPFFITIRKLTYIEVGEVNLGSEFNIIDNTLSLSEHYESINNEKIKQQQEKDLKLNTIDSKINSLNSEFFDNFKN